MPSRKIYHKRRKRNKDMGYKPNPCKNEYATI